MKRILGISMIAIALSISGCAKPEAPAQIGQPSMGLVGNYYSEEQAEKYSIYHFESGLNECYVLIGRGKEGAGITCLRKSSP